MRRTEFGGVLHFFESHSGFLFFRCVFRQLRQERLAGRPFDHL